MTPAREEATTSSRRPATEGSRCARSTRRGRSATTRESSAVREDAFDRPKRVLSLDGGSMPGTLALLTRASSSCSAGATTTTASLTRSTSSPARRRPRSRRRRSPAGGGSTTSHGPATCSTAPGSGRCWSWPVLPARRPHALPRTCPVPASPTAALAAAVESAVLDPPNDPSRSALDTVTSPRVGLGWSATRDDLLLVSIGTASRPVDPDPRCRRVHYDAGASPRAIPQPGAPRPLRRLPAVSRLLPGVGLRGDVRTS